MISLGYLIFLAVITLLYYILPHKFQRPLLLVASLAFMLGRQADQSDSPVPQIQGLPSALPELP